MHSDTTNCGRQPQYASPPASGYLRAIQIIYPSGDLHVWPENCCAPDFSDSATFVCRVTTDNVTYNHEVTASVGDAHHRTPSITKFEVRRLSISEDTAHFPSTAW